METAEKVYLTCAETAPYVRRALAEAFAGVRFSVRSHTYSGGASIDVKWTDGPTTRQVEPVVKAFEGADFDGMIDLKTYKEHYLLPDGSVRLARAEGTKGSRGVIPAVENPPPAGAKRVHFGANFIFCSREVSRFQEQEAEAAAVIRKRANCEGEPPHDQFGTDYVTDLARRMVYDRAEGEAWEPAYERVVLRR